MAVKPFPMGMPRWRRRPASEDGAPYAVAIDVKCDPNHPEPARHWSTVLYRIVSIALPILFMFAVMVVVGLRF